MKTQLTLDDWHDSTLLNSGWTLETIGVDTCNLSEPKPPSFSQCVSYLGGAQPSSSWCRRSRPSRHSWTRFVLSQVSYQFLAFQNARTGCASGVTAEAVQIVISLTLWDLLETLVCRSHICGLGSKLDRKLCL